MNLGEFFLEHRAEVLELTLEHLLLVGLSTGIAVLIRVATVISVGTATIAAAIDAGGLGRYIFRGLRMNDNTLILAGAVPAALMALAADLGLGWVEKIFKTGVGGWFKNPKAAWISLLAALGLIVWVSVALYPAKMDRRIAVGSKDFTEQIILGEIVAQVIESKTGLRVDRRFDLGGNLAHEALVAGEIDVYVEYTGTALTAILKRP